MYHSAIIYILPHFKLWCPDLIKVGAKVSMRNVLTSILTGTSTIILSKVSNPLKAVVTRVSCWYDKTRMFLQMNFTHKIKWITKYLIWVGCRCTELIHWMQGTQYCIQEHCVSHWHLVYPRGCLDDVVAYKSSGRYTNKMNLVHK